MSPSRAFPAALALLLLTAGCRAGGVPDIKQPGVFIEVDGYLVEIKKLGTLGTSYGPRVYPQLPEYDIPSIPRVTPIFLNLPELATAPLKGIEWHGYRLGGNANSRSSPPPTSVAPGIFKVVVDAADAQGRWKPEPAHEYFGIAIDDGYKPGSIWAVKIK